MQTEIFDVAVVGAGPAGANLARELAKAKAKVLLIERSRQIGEPNFSSAGMPDYVVSDFKIPKSVIANFWNKFQLVTPSDSHIWHFKKTSGYVLKFNELKKFLVEDAIANGAKAVVGTAVQAHIFKDKKLVGVKLSGIEKGEVFAKIFVDASGAVGILASSLKLRKNVPCPISTGMEFIVKAKTTFPKNTLVFFLGKKYVPQGYGWIFPMEGDNLKIGAAIYDSSEIKHPALVDIIKELIKNVPQIKSSQPLELHGGAVYINGGIKNVVKENLVVLGDAACQINPLGAEGIRHALYASRFAADAIKKALATSNNKELKNYQRNWQKYTGKKWKLSQFLSQYVYKKFTEAQFDKALSLAKYLSAEDIYDIFFEYKFQKGLKALKGVNKSKYLALFR